MDIIFHNINTNESSYPWIWTILSPQKKKSTLSSAQSSFAPLPRNKKGIISSDSMDIGFVINNLIHQLILIPFGINLWVHVISNNVCSILLQGSIREHKILYTSIKDWVRIYDTDHIPRIILHKTHELIWAHFHHPGVEALQKWCINNNTKNHQTQA